MPTTIINGTPGNDELLIRWSLNTYDIVYVVDEGDGDDWVVLHGDHLPVSGSTFQGGAGIDMLSIYFDSMPLGVNYTFNSALRQFNAGIATQNIISFDGFEHYAVITADGDDLVVTDSGNDSISVGTGANTVNTGDGDDSVSIILTHANSADGGAGTDTLLLHDVTFFDTATDQLGSSYTGFERYYVYSSASSAVVMFGAGDDFFRGTGRVFGHDGNDIIGWRYDHGLAFNDRYYGGAGNDELDGWAGDDLLDGGDGDDKLSAGVGNDILNGGNGDDTLSGGDGNDILRGDNGHDVITTGRGLDYAIGGAGNDLIIAHANMTGQVIGGRGVDGLQYSYDPTNYSNTGVPVIFELGNPATNFLGFTVATIEFISIRTGHLGDHIIGGNRSDFIDVGGGANTVDAKAGNDVVGVRTGLTNFLDGGAGIDTLRFHADVQVYQDNTAINIFSDGSDISDNHGSIYTHFEAIYVNGSQSNDTVLLEEGGNDVLYGNYGYDSLSGGQGNDRIYGGFNDDILNGGAGNDLLMGGYDVDVMTGGAGADRFMFTNKNYITPLNALDYITDFTQGEDIMILKGVDAVIGGADDVFVFIGDSSFSAHAGELRAISTDGINTLVQGDQDGDGVADFTLSLTGVYTLVEADFIL